MENREIEQKLIIGAQIRVGKQYAEEIGCLDAGEIITLVEGYFEHDNGLYAEQQTAPSLWNEGQKEFDSIYHLFGNNMEHFYDCEIL